MMITVAPANDIAFDFKDPKQISAVSLQIDSVLEPIVGFAKGISGTIKFDPAHPERSSGTIRVAVGSVQFSHEGYTATARGYALNETKYRELTLTVRKIENVKRVSPTLYRGVMVADFTCRGITKSKRMIVTANYLPGKAEERTGGDVKGDLLIVRTKFLVSRTEHGISEGIPGDMVADTIEVGVAVVGTHAVEAGAK